jgi:beta-mannosidase
MATRMRALLLLLVSGAAAAAPPPSLWRDFPIVTFPGTQGLTSLDGVAWTFARNESGAASYPATVPGDTISDLTMAGLLPSSDLLFENTFLNMSWDEVPYTYTSAPFTLSPALAALLSTGGEVYLVLDSVKLVGDVTLNGAYLGFANDQFLRTSFPVASFLSASGPNTLSVTISTSRDPRLSEGRVTGAGGGWDWGPIPRYVNGHPDDLSMSRGLVRSVYLAGVESAGVAITGVKLLVFYSGSYPTSPLTDATAGGWTIQATVYLQNPSSQTLTGVTGSIQGCSQINGADFGPVPPGASSVSLTLVIPPGIVELWWTADTTPPSRRGQPSQPLYNISVTIDPQAPGHAVSATRAVGFRSLVLVTANDTVPGSLEGLNGSGNMTMRWRLNGANLFVRGADIIPMEFLEARQSGAAYTRMLQSAVDGRFNTLRIDGIDAYFPDFFYEETDRLGLLLYHDIQYSQAQPAPTNTTIQDSELRYQLRRLSPHPSVAVYDACNECGGQGVYASFVMTVVADEDASRPPWPASPSGGWDSGVDRLTSLPNGQPMLPKKGGAAGGSAEPWTAAAALAAAPSWSSCAGGSSGGASCTLQSNVDYCDTCYSAKAPPAASAQACCDLCAAETDPTVCYAATFYENTCYFKPKANATVPIFAGGRVTVWPAGRGPIPPLPPPGPEPPQTLETHGPYLHGGGFPAVNQAGGSLFVTIPPSLFPTYDIGPQIPGTFASEFGSVAMSSFESMSATLAPEHWSIHGGMAPDTCTGGFFAVCVGDNPMAQRNYPQDNILSDTFGTALFRPDEVGEDAFARQLYMSLVAQALLLSSDIRARRSHNTWGTLIWQLNEIWPTGGWGTVEYGPALSAAAVTGGQIVGGRWKPIHHWLSTSVYTDVTAACGVDGRCYVKNDDALSAHPSVVLSRALLRVSDGAVLLNVTSGPISLPIGGGAIAWLCLDGAPGSDPRAGTCNATTAVLAAVGCAADGSDCVLLVAVSEQAVPLSAHTQLLAMPGPVSSHLPAPFNLTVTVAPSPNPDGTLSLSLSFPAGTPQTAVALLVTLTATVPGRFSDNAFTLVQPGTAAAEVAACAGDAALGPNSICAARVASADPSASATLVFVPWEGAGGGGEALLAGLRVQHLGLYGGGA